MALLSLVLCTSKPDMVTFPKKKKERKSLFFEELVCQRAEEDMNLPDLVACAHCATLENIKHIENIGKYIILEKKSVLCFNRHVAWSHNEKHSLLKIYWLLNFMVSWTEPLSFSLSIAIGSRWFHLGGIEYLAGVTIVNKRATQFNSLTLHSTTILANLNLLVFILF